MGGARRAQGCEGSTDQVAGYSLLNDQYVSQEESVSGAGSPRYLVRRLTTDEVVDYIGCEGPGPCGLGDALGMRSCSFIPVPRRSAEGTTLARVPNQASVWEVSWNRRTGPVPLVRVRAAGVPSVRGLVHMGSFMALFLIDTVDDGECLRTHERAVAVSEPSSTDGDAEPGAQISAPPPEVDLTAASDVDIALRPPTVRSPQLVDALGLAAMTASAAGLEGLGACWAQQALSIRASQRRPPPQTSPLPDVPTVEGKPDPILGSTVVITRRESGP